MSNWQKVFSFPDKKGPIRLLGEIDFEYPLLHTGLCSTKDASFEGGFQMEKGRYIETFVIKYGPLLSTSTVIEVVPIKSPDGDWIWVTQAETENLKKSLPNHFRTDKKEKGLE